MELTEDALISITCNICDGDGKVHVRRLDEYKECYRCVGTGKILISLEDWVKEIVNKTLRGKFGG